MVMSMLEKMYTQRDLYEGGEDNYLSMVNDIKVFSIKSQVYHYLKSCQKKSSHSISLMNQLKSSYEKASFQNLMLRHELNQLLDCFEAASLQVIPLKGIVFSETYFNSFVARGTADIDLLIRSSDLQKSISLVKKAGFTIEESEDPSNNHCSFVKNNPNSSLSVTVELHWNLDKEYYSDLHIDPFWDNSISYSNYNYVRVLSVQDTFYFTSLHAVRHKMDSLKYFIDLIQILSNHAEEIDFHKLKNRAKSDKTWRKINACLSILYQEVPFLEKIKFYPFRKRVLFWSLSNARKAQRNHKDLSYYVYKFYFNHCLFDSPKHLITSTKLFHVIYPPKIYLKNFLGEDKDNYSRWVLLKKYYLALLQQNSLKYHNA